MSDATSAFRVYRPSGALAPFVDFFWSCDRYAASHGSERVLPTGTADLIFRGETWHELRGGLTGPRSEYVTVAMQQPFGSGVHFNPGGAYPFVGGATVDLANTSAPGDLWGAAADELLEQLACALDRQVRTGIVRITIATR